MDLTTEQRDGVHLVHLTGELDTFAAPNVRDAIGPFTGLDGAVVDLSATTFIDSAGLHALFGVGRAAREAGTPIAFVLPAESGVRRVIELVQLADVVPVVETVDAAVARVAEDRASSRFEPA